MSIVAMVAAALGFLPVVAGAILQEAIDVAVILNALRALRGGVEVPTRIPGWTETSARLRAAHLELEPAIARIRATADILDGMGGAAACGPRGDPPVRVRRPPASRGAGGPDDLPDARRGDRLRRRDGADARDAPGDLPTARRSIVWSATSHRKARTATTGRTPAAAVRPGRDPAPASGAGRGPLQHHRRHRPAAERPSSTAPVRDGTRTMGPSEGAG